MNNDSSQSHHSTDKGSRRISFVEEDTFHPSETQEEPSGNEEQADKECECMEEAPLAPLRTSLRSSMDNSKMSHSSHRSSNPRRRRSSLELRKLPVHVLLTNQVDDDLSDSNLGDEDDASFHPRASDGDAKKDHPRNSCLRSTCLHSRFNLRTQMMLSFGLVSAFAILLVVVVCIVVSVMCGNSINAITRSSFEDYVRSKEGVTTRFLAESLTLRLLPTDLVQVVYEATLDRFAGYPTHADDSKVPFWDALSQTNRYPIRGTELPLDWQMNGGNVNEETQYEHVQHRWSWYQKEAPLSTESAVFLMQGMCDPNVSDPKGHSYLEGCSPAHNNLTTGGVISPSPTNRQVYQKASDLGPLLKSLYEFYLDVKELGIYFANAGSGATLLFPHYEFNTSNSYTSIGCNWLLEPHPYDSSRFIGTMEDHARCEANGIHQNGKSVSTRLYTPMDRAWCKTYAQNPTQVKSFGPYQSAWHESEWLMSIGRAVYDRVTQDFIGCIGIDYVLNAVEDAVIDAKVTNNSAVTLVRLDEEGTVVASSAFNRSEASRNAVVDELNVGVSQQTFASLRRLVDFDEPWDPIEVRHKFETFQVDQDGFSVKAYPVPPPPEVYDATYRPEFFAISSISTLDVSDRVGGVADSVSDTVKELCLLTLAVGLIGLVAIVIFIFIVSHAITLPLNYMNDVSSDIVNTFGSKKEEGIEMTQTTLESKCSPKTELSDVVKQFQKMVSRFSGSAMAKSMQVNVNEIDNRFPLVDAVVKVYVTRANPGFAYNFSEPRGKPQETEENGSRDNKRARGVPPRLHFGTVINDGAKSETTTFRTSDVELNDKTFKSPLFFWIVALIVTPLLITTVTISAFVTYSMSQVFFDNISEAQAEYIFLNKYALQIFAGLRASYASLAMRQSMRDNFLLLRFSSWLLFGGVARSDSFTELLGGTDECKGIANIEECSVYNDYDCDCAWNDRFQKEGTCENFDMDTRHLQKTFHFGLSEDILPNGDRFESSYPKVAYSASSTLWWPHNMSYITSGLPGSEKGSDAAGYDTTYDRFRAISAMPIFQTIYNADPYKEQFLSANIFFEADGLGIGFSGCFLVHLDGPNFVVNEEASALRPEICPVGKHGYDPRCRAWYDTGRKLAIFNNTWLHVTPPYHFAGTDNFFGQTATSPLIDPQTGEHVGQTLFDFASRGIFGALHHNNTPLVTGGFPIVITGLSDGSGADTVMGPNFSLVDSSATIGDVVLPFDGVCPLPSPDCERRSQFEAIRAQMKNGESGDGQFDRTRQDGSTETIHYAFAPVNSKVLAPVNSSDFSRGVNASDFLIYSLALAEPEEGMIAPFAAVEAEVHHQIGVAIVVLSCVIFLSVIFVVYVSSRITSSMTQPMIYLLQLIVHINKMSVDGTPAPCVDVDGSYGSREIVNVVETMETLYRIVQSANVAYFAGDVEKAYYVLADAARLFKRLENSKAEGVANNNLGNTMLAFYRTIEDTGAEEVAGFKKREVIGKGMGYYHRAIQLGEKAYDQFYEDEGWSPACLEFMQHLSNRYFNRAMFLLTVKDGHERPEELEELGFRDLQIAFDMDVEIVDQGTEIGWNVRGADRMMEVYLSRIRGHLVLLEMGYEDKWEIEETIENAFKLVKTEINVPSSLLFKEFCPAGRMQQIETELMRYKVLNDDLESAAQIAIRMLVEDEKTLQEAQLKAVEVLVLYFKSLEANEEQKNPKRQLALVYLEEYQTWLKHASDERNRSKRDCQEDDHLPASIRKGLSMRNISLDLSGGESESKMEPTRLDQMRMSALHASTRGDVTMEVF